MHPGGRQSWKYVQDPKTVSNCPRNGPESAKTASVDDLHVNAPLGSSIMEISPGPQNNVHETGQIRPKTASVDDRHVNAPRGSSIVEISPRPKTVSNSPRNWPESAKTASIYDRHKNAPWGSSIVEICPGPQNSE